MIPFLLFSVIFFSILLCVFLKFPIVYALIFGLVIFYIYGVKKGISLISLLKVTLHGALKSRLVLEIFILIGMITSLWICSGSVPFLVYHSLNIIRPELFIFLAFVSNAFISLLLGTSFGVVSTIGVVIITIARLSGFDTNITAGAIISGAYFGDRISPMSSSANLVAAINEINIYSHIKNMLKTTFIPLGMVLTMYLVLSLAMPLQIYDRNAAGEIVRDFKIGWVSILPVLALFVLIVLKVKIKKAMLFSAVCAFLVAVFYQNRGLADVLKYTVIGYYPDGVEFQNQAISGGGIVSMLYPAVVVAVSSAYAGVIGKIKILDGMETLIGKISSKFGTFVSMSMISVFSCATGCTQTLGIILGEQLAFDTYRKNNISKEVLALDISNTSVLLAAVIPWNMAGMVPALTLSVGIGYIPFSFYCFVPTFYILITSIIKHRRMSVMKNGF